MATAINNRGNQAIDPIRNFRFLVTFDKVLSTTKSMDFKASIGFTSVSGLAITTESIPYREGGYNTTVHQIPGQTTFSPVTFQHGVQIGARQNWDWMKMLFQTVLGSSIDSAQESFRTDVTIDVLNHPVPFDATAANAAAQSETPTNDLVVARFRLYNAWPTTLAYSDLNAGDNALIVEQMTLVHEGLTVDWASYNNGTIGTNLY